LIDIGSTTCDIIPLADGQPAAEGATDTERLLAGELIYTGVERTAVFGLIDALPWRKQQCPVAAELFATAWDAYLILGDMPEEPQSTHTADRRPATREAARDRLARMICADRETFDAEDARLAAEAIARAQGAKIAVGVAQVMGRMPRPPAAVVISGRGEFVARRVLERLDFGGRIVSLADELGPDLSQAAPAHALAVLARADED
jgi:probable H4MPT-linked C1 transfer pathway protein